MVEVVQRFLPRSIEFDRGPHCDGVLTPREFLADVAYETIVLGTSFPKRLGRVFGTSSLEVAIAYCPNYHLGRLSHSVYDLVSTTAPPRNNFQAVVDSSEDKPADNGSEDCYHKFPEHQRCALAV